MMTMTLRHAGGGPTGDLPQGLSPIGEAPQMQPVRSLLLTALDMPGKIEFPLTALRCVKFASTASLRESGTNVFPPCARSWPSSVHSDYEYYRRAKDDWLGGVLGKHKYIQSEAIIMKLDPNIVMPREHLPRLSTPTPFSPPSEASAL
jgi:hypothetical protein